MNAKTAQVSALPRAIAISVMADPIGTARTVAFWDAVADLIFDNRRDTARKVAVLRRYARLVSRTPNRSLADLALRLAESWEEQSPGLRVA
ncbi:MAG: hypothetical protein FJY99_08140 [Candidatus Sericytochromatia bacterium]|nr:hypothetical protein [Candidatus Tanganyikabacteria bacterium]